MSKRLLREVKNASNFADVAQNGFEKKVTGLAQTGPAGPLATAMLISVTRPRILEKVGRSVLER